MAARSQVCMLVGLVSMLSIFTTSRATCRTTDMEKLWKGSICVADDGCICDFSPHRMYCTDDNRLHVNLASCNISSLVHFTSNYSLVLPEIAHLNLSLNRIGKVEAGLFSRRQFNSLRVLDMTFNWDCYASHLFENGAFEGLNELTVLSLSLRNPLAAPSCRKSGNFTLDSLSTLSLSRNLTELHVTGSPVMEGLNHLQHLSTLNLGGSSCYLTNRSNLHLLSNLTLSRVSLRNCTWDQSSLSLLELNGIHSLLQSAVYLDLSCCSVTFDNVLCKTPLKALKVLMLDQIDGRFSKKKLCDPGRQPHSINLTAVSFEGYVNSAKFCDNVPRLNGTVFPQLTHLSIAKSNFQKFLIVIRDLLNVSSSRLQYLKFLDVSDIGTKNQASCSHTGARYHPWFMSADLHIAPSPAHAYTTCDNCQGFPLLPRLETLRARSSPSFPLDLTKECQFQPNRLSQLDISETMFSTSRKKCSGVFKGLDAVSVVHATGSNINLSILFDSFPNMTYLDISGADNVSLLFHANHTNLNVLKADGLSVKADVFPNAMLDADVKHVLPSLQTLSLADNNLKSVRTTLPSNLTHLNLRNNKILSIPSDTRQNFTRHSQRPAKFLLDLTRNPLICDCQCEGRYPQYFSWLMESTFVAHGDECDGRSEYKSIAECVDTSRQACSTPAPPSSPLDIVGFAIGGVLVVSSIVVAFFLYRRFRWRVGFWLSENCCHRGNDPPDVGTGKVFYLSHCSSDEVQADTAFELWNYAQNEDVGDIVLCSRNDIEIGAWTNQAITRLIRRSHGILLLMPDGEYSNDDEALYEFQLAIRFHEMQNIRPIIRQGTGGIEDIAGRIPPLLPTALRPSCLDIYPSTTDREAIGNFFSNLRQAVCESPSTFQVEV